MILILALKKYLPITANKKVAIKVITIYINAVIEKISTLLKVSELILNALPVSSSTPNIAAMEVPNVIRI
jgi:hypothetical protein